MKPLNMVTILFILIYSLIHGTCNPLLFSVRNNFQHEKAVDVRLRPGESKEYTFQEKIPPDAPPSYSGGFVKVDITQPTHNLVT